MVNIQVIGSRWKIQHAPALCIDLCHCLFQRRIIIACSIAFGTIRSDIYRLVLSEGNRGGLEKEKQNDINRFHRRRY